MMPSAGRGPGSRLSDDCKYWAFISYSQLDKRWGEWLHRQLESYRVPQRLVGQPSRHGPIPRRLFPIFRDRAELSSASELGDEIQRALLQSRYLIVICSCQAAASRWVNEEILRFKRLGREDRILCFVVDRGPPSGDLHQCFAPALRWRIGADGALSDVPAEPIAADAREKADGRRNAKLKLIAGMLGLGFDELRQRDLQARHRRQAFFTALASVVAAVTVVLAINAQIARRAAEHSRQQAEDLINFMLGDLRDRLEPVGRLDVLDAVDDKAMKYFANLRQDGQTDHALAARAKALRQIGDIRVQQGRLQDAAKSFGAALEIDSQRVNRDAKDTQAIFDLGQSQYWIGYAAWRAGDLDAAQQHLEAYRDSGRRLLELEPENPQWQQEAAYGESNLGTLAQERNRLEEALRHFQAARDIEARLVERLPDNVQWQLDYGESLAWIAVVTQKLGRLDEAQALLLQQAEIQRALVDRHPQDMTLKYRYVQPLQNLLIQQAKLGNIAGYFQRSDAVLSLSGELVAHDAGNLDWSASREMALLLRAQGQELRGELPAALASAQAAMQLAGKNFRADPGQSHWQQRYVNAANCVADLALDLARDATAASALDEAQDAAAKMKGLDAADRIAAADNALLRLELERRRGRPPSQLVRDELSSLLDQMQRSAPEPGLIQARRLRLAVLTGAASAPARLPDGLPRCGLEFRRLSRFLSRTRGEKIVACPTAAPQSLAQEKR